MQMLQNDEAERIVRSGCYEFEKRRKVCVYNAHFESGGQNGKQAATQRGLPDRSVFAHRVSDIVLASLATALDDFAGHELGIGAEQRTQAQIVAMRLHYIVKQALYGCKGLVWLGDEQGIDDALHACEGVRNSPDVEDQGGADSRILHRFACIFEFLSYALDPRSPNSYVFGSATVPDEFRRGLLE